MRDRSSLCDPVNEHPARYTENKVSRTKSKQKLRPSLTAFHRCSHLPRHRLLQSISISASLESASFTPRSVRLQPRYIQRFPHCGRIVYIGSRLCAVNGKRYETVARGRRGSIWWEDWDQVVYLVGKSAICGSDKNVEGLVAGFKDEPLHRNG